MYIDSIVNYSLYALSCKVNVSFHNMNLCERYVKMFVSGNKYVDADILGDLVMRGCSCAFVCKRQEELIVNGHHEEKRK